MVLGYSSADKWTFYNSSCFEYVTIYRDITDGDIIVVLDSDLTEFKNEYLQELREGLFIKLNEYEVKFE